MQPVWVLSVDLQTKTATFQSGLGDAARSARGAFNDIKGGSGEMGRAVSGNMMEARHGVMLLGEEFGIHLPRALTSFIASIGPIGAAMEAAFPFLAIAVGATLLIEHLAKMHEAGEKLTESQVQFGNAAHTAFNALDNQILQAQIRADELRGDHLGALKKELKLIDNQSMENLVQSFDKLAKHADVVFLELKRSWYQFGAGSDGAKHALTTFISEYDRLQLHGESDQASGLLAGTLKQAEKILEFQKQYAASQAHGGGGGDYAKFEEASDGLKKFGVSVASTTIGLRDETAAQQEAVNVLRDYVYLESQAAKLKDLNKGNATTVAHNKVNREADGAAQAAAEAAEHERQERIKAMEDTYREELTQVQEGERQQIAETKEGSSARLAAIDAALQEERDHMAEGTGFYRNLLTERTNLVRQMAEEENKQRIEAKREASDSELRMDELAVAAHREHIQVIDSVSRVSDQQRLAQQINVAEEEHSAKMRWFARDKADLDKSGKDYNNKLKAIQDKEKQQIQQHENEIAAIKEKAEVASNARILSANQRFQDSLASGLSQAIMGHQSFAKMVTSLGDQVVSGMIQNAIKSMMTDDMTKEKDAAAAARKAFNIGMGMGPAGIVLGPVFGAAAFAAVMAFEGGGIVPGVGRGDTVPAMLTPGEGVVPKGVMEGLSNMSKFGGMQGGGSSTVVHVRPVYHVQTIDGNGMKAALEKHTDVLQRHFENTLRKMNR